MTAIALRIVITIIILIFVWMNSHWSVALVLSLLSLRAELQDAERERMNRRLAQIQTK